MNHSIEIFRNNGCFVGIINELEERKKIDEYEAFLVECNDPTNRAILEGKEFGLKKVDGVKNDKIKTLTKEIGEILRRNIRNLCFEGP